MIFFYFYSFIFKENHVLIAGDNLLEKNCDSQREIDGIDIDDIGNFVGLLRPVFIHEELGNLKIFVDGAQPTRNIIQKKK